VYGNGGLFKHIQPGMLIFRGFSIMISIEDRGLSPSLRIDGSRIYYIETGAGEDGRSVTMEQF